MKLRKLILIPLVTLLLPMNSPAAPSKAADSVNDPPMHQIIMPQYTYTSDTHLVLDLSGSEATCFVKIVGYSSVTKITGTMTLYRQNSNGSKTRVASWSLSTDGNVLQSEKTALLSSNGKYVLTFSGKVYSGSKSETVSITTSQSS